MARDLGADNLQQSRALRSGVIRKDAIGGTDPADFYWFRLKGRSSLKLDLRALRANADLEIVQDRDRDGTVDVGEVVASSRASGNAAESIAIDGLGSGTYFIRVFPKTESSTVYRLTLTTTPTDRISPTYDVVLKTNAYRVQNGLQPLALNTQLTNAAQTYARAMAVQDNFSHTGADGSSPWDRMRAADYDYSEAAENLAAGHTSAASAMRGWINSSGHRRNLLAYQVQEIGVGYFYLGRDTGRYTYRHYWAQSMATPADVRVTPRVPEGISRD
ncbi:pre-peptidase C-terminal domain-containing protein [Oscillatoria sp. FACHB-1407]|uniref:CAP domain-containing protein n=1 Tax=Oscillatoria sp. FACHB-1407 TaxID=2692847 RepID=UPI0016820530|nr:CAP domain-containing protein [Oscillatoria sp. FACHB-1407]MBD2460967.1 pre-peptidase C-terminal domain-containing protein [Oscillatoria sp. FACHB-1407]